MYKLRIPKKQMLLFLLLLTLGFASNALAASGGLEQDSGPYQIIMQITPENLMVNQAGTMTMIIKNKATGQPVTGAKVIMMPSTMGSNVGNSGSMADMDMSSGMNKQGGSPMQEQSSRAMDSGTYIMQGMTFNQAGQWNQAVTINSPLGAGTVNFPITVAKSGLNFVLIGSVVGFVGIAGILAAILKKKKS